MIFAMFPGQGSQFVGMGKELFDQFPRVTSTFEEASDATKLNIKRLCLEGPEDQLTLTANAQPAIVTLSVAVWRVLQAEVGFEPKLFAGHSLGEYSAAVAAGKLAFERATFLVRKRGEFMQEAVPAGVGAMAAVLNLEASKLEQLCKKASRDDTVVEVVNYNSPQQLVVAGHKVAVDRLLAELQTLTVKAVPLAVSAPFHSRLMGKAREAMTPLLSDTPIQKNAKLLVANITGEVAEDYDASYLVRQIDSPVRWTQTIATADAAATQIFLEIGPGRVLTGLVKRTTTNKEAKLLATSDLPKTIAELQQIIA